MSVQNEMNNKDVCHLNNIYFLISMVHRDLYSLTERSPRVQAGCTQLHYLPTQPSLALWELVVLHVRNSSAFTTFTRQAVSYKEIN